MSKHRQGEMDKLQDTIHEADRILSPMPQTRFIQVHNVISSSEMARFKAYEEEKADRFTKNLRFK